MAENQSGCLTEQQIKVANIVSTSFSFGSFVFGLVSVLFYLLCYYCYKQKHRVDPTEGILFCSLVTFTLFELVDSFQWFVLLRDATACTVLGAVREYVLISALVTLICLGIHLLILVTHPKCLRVIKEEKQKRYKILQRCFIIASFVIPALFVPWPFIETGYGKDEYLCWLAYNCNASDSTASYVLGRLLMWHFWAFFVWMFAVAVLVVATYRYCIHKSASSGTKSKPNHNVCTLIFLLLAYIIAITANVLLFTWKLIAENSSFPLTLQAIVLTPLMIIVYAFIIMIRQVRNTMFKNNEIVTNINGSLTTYDMSYGATYFVLPEDEWD